MTAEAGMGLSRRELLRGAGGMVVVAAAVRLGGGSAMTGPPRGRGLDGLALADFATQVGTRFDVRVDGRRSLPLTLTQAVDRPARTHTRRPLTGDAFSLLFVGDPATDLPSATYTFSSPALGRFPLFVAGLGPGAGGRRYEAVVNRLTVAR